MHRVGIFDDHDMLALTAKESHVADHGCCIRQQGRAERRVGPGAGNNLCPIARADLVFIGIYDLSQSIGINQPFAGQDRFQRFDPQSGVRGKERVRVVVMIMRHDASVAMLTLFVQSQDHPLPLPANLPRYRASRHYRRSSWKTLF